MNYARELYHYSALHDDSTFMAIAQMNIASSFMLSHQPDSSLVYYLFVKNNSRHLPEDYQYILLSNIGACYYEKKDYNHAKEYLQRSIKINSAPQSLTMLADILWQENKKNEALYMWDRAFENADPNLKSRILYSQSDFYKSVNEMEKALDCMEKAQKWKIDYSDSLETEAVSEINYIHEKRNLEKKHSINNNKLSIINLWIFFTIFVIIIIMIIIVAKYQRQRTIIEETNKRINIL